MTHALFVLAALAFGAVVWANRCMERAEDAEQKLAGALEKIQILERIARDRHRMWEHAVSRGGLQRPAPYPSYISDPGGGQDARSRRHQSN